MNDLLYVEEPLGSVRGELYTSSMLKILLNSMASGIHILFTFIRIIDIFYGI